MVQRSDFDGAIRVELEYAGHIGMRTGDVDRLGDSYVVLNEGADMETGKVRYRTYAFHGIKYLNILQEERALGIFG